MNSRHQNQCISLVGVKNSCVFLGVDRGGLRREWFELLCKALFSHESGFFTRFNKDDPQALVSFSDYLSDLIYDLFQRAHVFYLFIFISELKVLLTPKYFFR